MLPININAIQETNIFIKQKRTIEYPKIEVGYRVIQNRLSSVSINSSNKHSNYRLVRCLTNLKLTCHNPSNLASLRCGQCPIHYDHYYHSMLKQPTQIEQETLKLLTKIFCMLYK